MAVKIHKVKKSKFISYKVTFDVRSKEDALALLCCLQQSYKDVSTVIDDSCYAKYFKHPYELKDKIYALQGDWLSQIKCELENSLIN